MYHCLDNTKSDVLKHYFFNEIETVEAQPVKIAVVKSVTFRNKYGALILRTMSLSSENFRKLHSIFCGIKVHCYQ